MKPASWFLPPHEELLDADVSSVLHFKLEPSSDRKKANHNFDDLRLRRMNVDIDHFQNDKLWQWRRGCNIRIISWKIYIENDGRYWGFPINFLVFESTLISNKPYWYNLAFVAQTSHRVQICSNEKYTKFCYFIYFYL